MEMEANGVELGIMNMKLLEKIEELTLYTLQQERQIKLLTKKNETLNQLEKEVMELKNLFHNFKNNTEK